MTLVKFHARCPHCSHEFNANFDSDRSQTQQAAIKCPSCEKRCQVKGDDVYYLIPTEVTNIKSSSSKQKSSKQNTSSSKQSSASHKSQANKQKEPTSKRSAKKNKTTNGDTSSNKKNTSKPKHQSTEKPDDELGLIDSLSLLGYLLVGIMALSIFQAFNADNLSPAGIYHNILFLFSNGWLKFGKAIVVGFIVGVIISSFISVISKPSTGSSSIFLGTASLIFIIYCFFSYGLPTEESSFQESSTTQSTASHQEESNSNSRCKGDCINGSGTFLYDNGQYEGEWHDGARHGYGVYSYTGGNQYSGYWDNGEKRGQGVFTYSNGERYDGEWLDGKWHGIGTYSWPDGSNYKGEWRNDEEHGHGTYTWPNGQNYKGEWRNGDKHGHGTYTWANGDKRVGKWRYDKQVD